MKNTYKTSTNTSGKRLFSRRPPLRGVGKRGAQSADTSWNQVSEWYSDIVGKEGHFFHQSVILPQVLKWLQPSKSDHILDVGCGSGVLERAISPQVAYTGFDLSPKLIRAAESQQKRSSHHFFVQNAEQPFKLKTMATKAVMILSLQNMSDPAKVFRNIAQSLTKDGELIIILNHPCFRIPRQSSWGIDEKHKTQYRRIDRYLSPLKIPVTMSPGSHHSSVTWSFHFSLSEYSQFLKKTGFVILELAELVSPKKSEGKAAKMENRSRDEFPLFLAIHAKKA